MLSNRFKPSYAMYNSRCRNGVEPFQTVSRYLQRRTVPNRSALFTIFINYKQWRTVSNHSKVLVNHFSFKILSNGFLRLLFWLAVLLEKYCAWYGHCVMSVLLTTITTTIIFHYTGDMTQYWPNDIISFTSQIAAVCFSPCKFKLTKVTKLFQSKFSAACWVDGGTEASSWWACFGWSWHSLEVKLQYINKTCVSLWWQRHRNVLILFPADTNTLISWMMIINSSWVQVSFSWKHGSWKQPLRDFARVNRVLLSISQPSRWSQCTHRRMR